MRDLGASICFTNNVSTEQSQARFDAACRTLYRIQCLPHSRTTKTSFVATTAHPQALYGCEVGHVDEGRLRHYSSKVLTTIGTKNLHHARSITYGIYTQPHRFDIDPLVLIFYRRFAIFRRLYHKSLYVRTLITQLLNLYLHRGHIGIFQEDTDLSSLTPSPLPGDTGRPQFKAAQKPQGPIALLLQNVHQMGAAFDISSCTLLSSNFVPISVLEIPFQHFKHFLTKFGFCAVHAAYHSTRTVLTDLPKFDPDIYLSSLPKDDDHFVNVI
eukprot:12420288-Karenia_brevis.AAC.1